MAADLNFFTEPTPNPAEVSLRVRVGSNQLDPSTMPVLGQAYNMLDKSILNPRVNENGFGSYVYINSTQDGPYIWLHFGKPKTTAEMNTPFRTSYSTRFYPWPPVLELLRIIQSTDFPRVVYNGKNYLRAPRYTARYKYRPTPSINSVIKIDQFLAPTPWSGQALTHQQPTPTEISGTYLGLSISFPRCLHPKVILDDSLGPGRITDESGKPVTTSGSESTSVIYGQGTVTVPFTGNLLQQVFPATNFLDWAPFVLEDQCQPVNGLYLRERITVYPPFRPTEIQN
jgi:hypothetical protein